MKIVTDLKRMKEHVSHQKHKKIYTMPSGKNTTRQTPSEKQDDRPFSGNEEKQVREDNDTEKSTSTEDRDEYRSRNLEIEKERD